MYHISEPNHWEKTNIFYIIGEERNILIDTGSGIKPLKNILLTIDDKPIDVLLTHGHWDHLGNVHEFERVYVHCHDRSWVKNGLPIPKEVIKNMMIRDVDERYLQDFSMPKLQHDQPLDISNFQHPNFHVYHTPGHSPGSVVIYDSSRQALFSGDVVYEGTIYCHYESTDPQALYKSLNTIATLEIDTIYSGHYNFVDKGIINDLTDIMGNLEKSGQLKHGQGLTCLNKVCLQL